jgi:hypothetical protein
LLAKQPQTFLLKGELIVHVFRAPVNLKDATSCVYVAANPLVFPDALYGSTRLVSVNLQALLSTIALGGHLWHAYRARSSEEAKTYLSFAIAPQAMQEAIQPVKIEKSSSEPLEAISEQLEKPTASMSD